MLINSKKFSEGGWIFRFSLALAIPFIFVFVTGLLIAPNVYVPTAQESASDKHMLWPMVRATRIFLFSFIIFIGINFFAYLRQYPFTLSLIMYALASFAWSENPLNSIMVAATIFSLFCFVLISHHALGVRRLILLIWLSSMISILASTALALLGSPYALMPDGLWRGLFPHKNTFGAICAFTLILTLFSRPIKELHIFIRMLSVLLLAATVTMSGSAVALVMVAAGVIWGAGTWLVRSAANFRPALGPIVASAIAVSSIMIIPAFPIILEFLGRDLTFTGRTRLWNGVFHLTLDTPFGRGYATSGGAAAIEAVSQQARQFYTAIDNGYLVLALDLGWPATIAYAFGMIFALVNAVRRGSGPFGRTAASAIILAQIIIAFTEKSGGPYLSFGTLLVMIIIIRLGLKDTNPHGDRSPSGI